LIPNILECKFEMNLNRKFLRSFENEIQHIPAIRHKPDSGSAAVS
jgi:hypothetical protein